jgi:hypothetical protein
MIKKVALLWVLFMVMTGCTTTGHFKVPEGADLYIYKRPQPVEVKPNGEVTTKPFFWAAAGIPPDSGIPYRVEKDGNVLKEGRLRAKFRVVSIFWPPAALIYWPMGFNPNITYDLVNGTQE